MDPLLIVDGDNLAHRAYHSTPKTVTGKDGFPLNAVVGFFGMLLRVWQEEKPRGVFVASDTLGVDTYRSELWPPYQTGRVFDPEIVQQLDILPGLCRAFGFGTGKQAGFEADDVIASAVAKEVGQEGTCLVFTTDRDAYQLASPSVTVLAARRGTRELDRIGPSEVVQLLGVLPEQVPDYKALCGDASDKIPGVSGIGPKGAASLILRHGTLDEVIAAWGRPAADAEAALKFREVVTMRPEVDVVLPETGSPDWASGASALREIGADTLAERVLRLA